MLLRLAIESHLDGVEARTIRGKDPDMKNSVEEPRRLGNLEVLRLTGDSVEGVYSISKTHILKSSLKNLP